MFIYSIKRHALSKGIKLRVIGSNVVVTASKRVSLNQIENFVTANTSWVLKHLSVESSPVKDFEHDSILDWFGKEYTVTVGNYSRVKFLDTQFVLPAKIDYAQIIKTLRALSKKQLALDCLALAQKHGFKVNKISVRDTSTRWGSCSSSGNISLNWRLAFAPTYVKDYVIIHELCHLTHMNHSKDFWDLVKSKFIEVEKAKKWLKINSSQLTKY